MLLVYFTLLFGVIVTSSGFGVNLQDEDDDLSEINQQLKNDTYYTQYLSLNTNNKEYTTELQIAEKNDPSKKHKFVVQVRLDIGSVYLVGTDCRYTGDTKKCEAERKFDETWATVKSSENDFEGIFKGKNATGALSTSKGDVAKATEVPFIDITHFTDTNYTMLESGILGIGFSNSKGFGSLTPNIFLTKLAELNVIGKPAFTIHLKHFTDPKVGTITFGKPNPAVCDINSQTVLQSNTSTWTFYVESASMNNVQLNHSTGGTLEFSLVKDMVNIPKCPLHQIREIFKIRKDDNEFDCGKVQNFKPLTLKIGGKDVLIPPSAFYLNPNPSQGTAEKCKWRVRESADKNWIFGKHIFQQFCVEYDYDATSPKISLYTPV